MKATVNVLCYKSKTLKNGEHPLMICVCKGGKRKYISLGISVNPNYWDFKKGKPKRNCPNREQINLLIKEQEQKYLWWHGGFFWSVYFVKSSIYISNNS